MKRYPLQTLLKLRAHRTEAARQAVLEKQRAVAACREECQRIGGEIEALGQERADHRARLLDAPPAGVPWPVALERREAHIGLLGEHIVAAQQRLQAAQARLREAEQALETAKQAYFRAKAREDALEKRKRVWRDEQFALEAHQEEDAAADLLLARYIAPGSH
ncbi:phosphoenolpyruvate carboxylase [Luteimonas sp. Y-2-2-4F]|nr:YscO family type III secretion system apparatus protein [Luteimonas sp. Y-2-2-4F]MCD9032384.1 phosphoenolpyruvate carboxylase [Luteimonas sp. Y-2-2-4F]